MSDRGTVASRYDYPGATRVPCACQPPTRPRHDRLAPRGRPRSRPLLLTALLTLTAVGLATKSYTGPGAAWIRGSLGGAFYVACWMAAWWLVRPRASGWLVAGVVLAATCGIEAAQLVRVDWLDALRATRVGGLVLGSTFAWADFPAYVLGAGLGLAMGRAARMRER